MKREDEKKRILYGRRKIQGKMSVSLTNATVIFMLYQCLSVLY